MLHAVIQNILRDGDGIGEVLYVLRCDKKCHDLGHGGRIHVGVTVLLCGYLAGFGVYQNGKGAPCSLIGDQLCGRIGRKDGLCRVCGKRNFAGKSSLFWERRASGHRRNGKNESGCECGGDGNKSSPDGRYRSIHEYLLKIKTGITDISMVAL